MPLGILHGLWPTYQPTKSRAFLSMPSTGFMLKGTPLAHFFCTCKLKEFRKTPETWAAMMLVNSVGNAKSVGSIVQSKKNNTTNIIKHLHVYGVFNFKHWPIPDFRLMFFLVFSKRTLNHCSELGTSFPFLVLDDPSQIYNGDPVFTWSWDDYVKDISQIQDHFRDGIDGMCQTTKKTWSVASTPFRHPAKFSGERRNCGGFLGHGGLMGVSWGYPSAIGVPPWLWKPQSIWNHFSQNVAVSTRDWAQSSQSKKTLRMADK